MKKMEKWKWSERYKLQKHLYTVTA